MICLNIVDNGNGGVEIQERVAIFAAFHNDRVAPANAVSRMQQRKVSPQHNRRVALRFHENMGNHGGRGGFSMGAGNADGVLILTHDQPPRLRALKNRDTHGTGGGNFGIVIVGGGCADDAVRALNVARAVADMHLNALFYQLIGRDRRVHIRAGNGHAHAPKHQTQRTHGDTADTNQMYMFSGHQIGVQAFTDCHKKASR